MGSVPILNGPPYARQRNDISMAFRWWDVGGVLAWFSSVGGGRASLSPHSTLDPRMKLGELHWNDRESSPKIRQKEAVAEATNNIK